MKNLTKNKLLQTCLFLTLIGLLLITPIGKASASTEWNLKITSLAGTTVNYSYNQLLAMPMFNVSASLFCFGNLVTYGLWSGVSLSYLLEQVGVDPAVASIDFKAQDGYSASLPLQVAMLPNVIIAYEKDGSPLSEELRLVLPGENGAMWIALITSITMNAAVIDSDQYLSSTTAVQSQLPPMNSIGQSTAQQQEPAQAHPTAAPKNETKTEPIAPPANITQPDQKTTPQQDSNPKSLGFPVMVVYGIALGAIVALVAASYLAYNRRRSHKR
jgi:DMSO/TMAO reductase YedYZ molybdopterin-dependent catalytic subunit